MRSCIDFTGGNHVAEGGPADQLMRPVDPRTWVKAGGRGARGVAGGESESVLLHLKVLPFFLSLLFPSSCLLFIPLYWYSFFPY